MKSKISFFNKTIFWKNVSLYWPIWAGYLVVLLFMQPIMLWSNFQYGKYYEEYTAQMKLEDTINTLSISINNWVIVLAAVVIGMALYSYIYNAKSANMIHALPVDKTQLFGTNVISGLVFLIVPQFITSIISMAVCLSYGMSRLELIGMWLVESVAIAFIAFALVSCCAMFTGLLVGLPIYVFVVSFLSKWLYYMLYLVVNVYAYGASNIGGRIRDILNVYLSPLNALTGYIGFQEVYEDEVCIGMEIFGGKLLAAYVVVAVALYVVAYFTYKKRHIEKAGEWITVEWLKPVFRFVAGMSLGIYGGIMIRILLEQMGIKLEGIGFIILMLLLGGFGYFIAEMIVRKNFHVFQKRNWVKCGIFSVILLICFGGMVVVADVTEKYVPEKEDVENVSIYMGYDIDADEEEVEQFIEIHKKIVENLEVIEERAESMNYEGSKYHYVNISYRLKNGDYIDRHYSLFSGEEEIDAIINELVLLETDPETFLESNLCKHYKDITFFGGGFIEAQFVNSPYNAGVTDPIDYSYETVTFTPEQTRELYQAVIADVREGTLMKYNVNSYWMYEEDKNYGCVNLYLDFQNPDENSNPLSSTVYSGDTIIDDKTTYEETQTAVFNVGKDCENVMKKLIEFGAIESVDDIFWGEYEE